MAEEKEAPAEEAAPKPKSKKKLIIIIVAAVLVVGGGAGFFLMKGGKKPEAAEEEPTETKKHYETVDIGTFTVNLSMNSSFLKVKVLLEYDPEILAKAGEHSEGGGGAYGGGGEGEKDKGLPGVLGQREPMIRDAIIRVLSSKRAEDVLTQEGKDQLKEEMMEAINEATGLEEGPIVNVYFIEFIVQ